MDRRTAADTVSLDELSTRIAEPRRIVSRRALRARLEAILRDESPDSARSDILEVLKQALSAGRAEIRKRFDAEMDGPQMVRANCYLADQIIRTVYDHASEQLYPLGNPSKGEVLSLVAVGGYGRGELAPYSDIDLLFLLPYKLTPRSEQVVEAVLYFLWDLGFKVGQSVRSVDECIRLAKSDHTICTSLLEARWLWGNQPLYGELCQRFRAEVQRGGLGSRAATVFIEAKLGERDERHRRLGDSRYFLEPNIKDGKGGLRDLHTLFWIAKFLYDVDDMDRLVEKEVFTRAEARRFRKARDFLVTTRCQLHLLAGRAEERLTFDMQHEIAPRLSYHARAGVSDIERFMKHYFLVAKDVGDLTRIFCAALEAIHRRNSGFRLPKIAWPRKVGGFRVERDRITLAGPEVFKEKPVEMLRIFQVAQQHGLDIHPQVLRWVTQNLKHIKKPLREDPKANEIFLDILTSENDPEIALRRLNEAGVLGRFFPEFGRVVAQMQYNMYHHFTVDEHLIVGIGILHAIEKGRLKGEAPIASEVVHKVLSRRVLYVAVLLHDICKGRAGDHSELGAKLALKVCPRFGLTEAETETVSWLVRDHLRMSDTAFKRDLDDPKTIQDFTDLVQSPERLRLLLVLTVADIRAVGPNVWTAWKAALLRELYWRTEEVLSGGMATTKRDQRVKAAREALSEDLSNWSKSAVKAHLRLGVPSYWVAFDRETLARHARMVREAEDSGAPVAIDTRVDRYRQATEVTIYTADITGLFCRIAGAIAVAGASIDAAKIFTLKNGMALDAFYVEDAQGGPFDSSAKRAKLSAALRRALSGRLRPLQELEKARAPFPSRYRVFKVQPRVLIDNKASRDHTVIEVNGRDRRGLLYEVTLVLAQLRLSIRSARIATFGERVVDVFYVQDRAGAKVEGARRVRNIETKLLEVLAQTGAQEDLAVAEAKIVGRDALKAARRKRSAERASPRAAE